MKPPTLQVVILAAGRGERLRPLTDSIPKPLVTVAGKAILGRMLEILQDAGLHSVTMVVGYRGPAIRRYVDEHFSRLTVRYVRNPIYASSNTLCSLSLAASLVDGRPFLLIDGDLVFEPRVLDAVLRPGAGSRVACDISVALDSEAVCAYGDEAGRILHIGKNISAGGVTLGESIGLARISARASRPLLDVCVAAVRRGRKKQYYEAAFQELIDRGFVFFAVDVQGLHWSEIDTRADLRRAVGLLTPGESERVVLAAPRASSGKV